MFILEETTIQQHSGSRVAIAILDSGIEYSLPTLGGLELLAASSFTDGNPLLDPISHGTEMASILLNAEDSEDRPIENRLTLAVGQVIGNAGFGSVETLCEGMYWAARLGVDVIAVPSGVQLNHETLRHTVQEIADEGILMFAPVGNPCRGQTGPLYPARYEEVIAVGCADYRKGYLTWSCKPDVLVREHTRSVLTSTGKYCVRSGTSCATMVAVSLLSDCSRSGSNKASRLQPFLQNSVLNRRETNRDEYAKRNVKRGPGLGPGLG